MVYSSKLYSDPNSLQKLAIGWDRILSSCGRGIMGPDATCSSVWAQALCESHLRGSTLQALAISANEETVAILPAYRSMHAKFPFTRRDLRLVTSVYAGRCAFLVANDDPALVETLLEHLRREVPDWDVLVFSLVAGSRSYASVESAARVLSMRMRCLSINESPYVELGSTWNATLASLPKKFRWTIRSAERDLHARGKIEHLEVTDATSAPALVPVIYEIEQRSWKEGAGTSITSRRQQQAFYEALIPLAAARGILSAHLLLLDGRPIAYILGLVAGDGTFLDLKESYDINYSEYSPGHVLKRFAIESLIERGVRTYDFMGNCEPYKMKWTEKTYRNVTVVLFNSTFRGWLFHMGSCLFGGSQHLRATDSIDGRCVAAPTNSSMT